MKLNNHEIMSFMVLGTMCLNAGLMAAGVETMPGLWVHKVYEDPALGASIGSITGVGLGGMAAGATIGTKEMVKADIKKMRQNSISTHKKLEI